jgi:hypothetical protein
MPLKKLSAQERLEKRNKLVRAKVDEYFKYLDKLDPDDPSLSEKAADAIRYSLNQKEYLCRFLKNGDVPIDNGACLSEGITYPHLFPKGCIESGAIGKRCA